MTEAYCLLHEPFKDGPYDEKELKRVMKALSDFGPKIVILTGAYTDGEKIGAACYDREKTRRRWCFPTACRANTTARGIFSRP